jgi:hypothetical protein
VAIFDVWHSPAQWLGASGGGVLARQRNVKQMLSAENFH